MDSLIGNASSFEIRVDMGRQSAVIRESELSMIVCGVHAVKRTGMSRSLEDEQRWRREQVQAVVGGL
jgi:hypothetical protein